MLIAPGGESWENLRRMLVEPGGNPGRTWGGILGEPGGESWENLRRILVEPRGNPGRTWGGIPGEPGGNPGRT